ncbi:Pentatricopeptide repeat-containing protein [Nymphaea thermarum]|nr:Pentatricopeptide repeat-containing protein [Nymphaea thermarum]
MSSMLRTGLLPSQLLTTLRSSSLPINLLRQIHAKFVVNPILCPTLHIFNSIIHAYALTVAPKQAFTFYVAYAHLLQPNNFTLQFLLKACSRSSSVWEAFQVHTVCLKLGFHSYTFLQNALVHLYSVCGQLGLARKVFDEIPERDLVSYNCMVHGYAESGDMDAAFRLFEQIHEPNVITRTAMVVGYAATGDIESARKMFDEMPERDLASWNALITCYAKCGIPTEAIALFRQMQECGIRPNAVTITTLLSACASIGALDMGKWIHVYLNKNRFHLDFHLGSALVDMYAKCGSIELALQVFNSLREKNLCTWNAMINGLAMHGHAEQALVVFNQLLDHGTMRPDEVTLVGVLTACSHGGFVDEGLRHFHFTAKKYGVTLVLEHYACIVDLLSRCALLKEAEEVIKSMPIEPDIVVWRALLGGCRLHKNVEFGERVIAEMNASSSGDYVLLSNIYGSAGRWEDVEDVRRKMKAKGIKKEPGLAWKLETIMPSKVFDEMPQPSLHYYTSRIVSLARSGTIHSARLLFDRLPQRDLVSWNAMLSAYSQTGYHREALSLFMDMRMAGFSCDPYSFTAAVSACANAGHASHGLMCHACIAKSGLDMVVEVTNSLLTFYAKFDCLQEATKLFKCLDHRTHVSWNVMIDAHMRHENMDDAFTLFQLAPEKNIISWTIMIVGCTRNGYSKLSLDLFVKMRANQLQPDDFTFAAVLHACASLALLGHGKVVHACIVRMGFCSSVYVANGLINMYAKCGDLLEANKVFDAIKNKDKISWNAMISGLGQHGKAEEVLRLFKTMVMSNMRPDKVTFIGLLMACRHSGLFEQAWQHFESMVHDYGVTPDADHVACMIDILGRAGSLREACSLVKDSYNTEVDVSGSLLGSCLLHGDVDLARRVAGDLLLMEPKEEVGYVLLSNLYCGLGQWLEAQRVRKYMVKQGGGDQRMADKDRHSQVFLTYMVKALTKCSVKLMISKLCECALYKQSPDTWLWLCEFPDASRCDCFLSQRGFASSFASANARKGGGQDSERNRSVELVGISEVTNSTMSLPVYSGQTVNDKDLVGRYSLINDTAEDVRLVQYASGDADRLSLRCSLSKPNFLMSQT